MTRYSHSGTAAKTTLASPMTNVSTSAVCVSLVGYPDTITGPFVVTIDRDTEFEEKVLVSLVVGNTATISQRGFDGTTAKAHSADATFEHTFSSVEADEANDHVQRSTGVHGLGPGDGSFVGTTKSQTMTGKTMDGGSNTFTNLPSSASPAIVALIDAEAATRDAADDAEAAARIAGDNNEAALRIAGDNALTAAIAAAVAAAVPVGTMSMFAGASAPSGYLICDGSAVLRATYPALYTLLGTTYGAGDGSTTFNLPDLRQRAPRGVGPGYTLASSGGADTTTLAVTNLPGHQHDMVHGHYDDFSIASGGSHTHGTDAANVIPGTTGSNDFEADPAGENRSFDPATISAGGSHTHTLNGQVGGATSNVTGSGDGCNGTAFDVRNPYITVNFIIKAT